MKKYRVDLTYDELMLLDGKVSDEAQKVIENAKTENSFGLDDFCNEILRIAVERGELTCGTQKISKCEHCSGKPSGYYRYSRSSRYHRKGEIDYDHPFSYTGIKPFQGLIVFQGLPGVCVDCWRDKYLPKIVKYIIDNDLPVELQKNDIAESAWKKDKMLICYDCRKEMYESEMEQSPTIFGDGSYPADCPHCGAHGGFGRSHEITDKFRMIKIKTS